MDHLLKKLLVKSLLAVYVPLLVIVGVQYLVIGQMPSIDTLTITNSLVWHLPFPISRGWDALFGAFYAWAITWILTNPRTGADREFLAGFKFGMFTGVIAPIVFGIIIMHFFGGIGHYQEVFTIPMIYDFIFESGVGTGLGVTAGLLLENRPHGGIGICAGFVIASGTTIGITLIGLPLGLAFSFLMLWVTGLAMGGSVMFRNVLGVYGLFRQESANYPHISKN